jgi:hypothetical protein
VKILEWLWWKIRFFGLIIEDFHDLRIFNGKDAMGLDDV